MTHGDAAPCKMHKGTASLKEARGRAPGYNIIMEQIYTIPVNEAFEASAKEGDCPFCRLYKKLEADEMELILGASMMEPDVRIKTNEAGFCPEHFEMLLDGGKRLPLALMLESHLEYISDMLKPGMFPAKTAAGASKKLGEVADGCYVCGRIEYNFSRMIETAALLWQSDIAFKDKASSQNYFCLPHYARFLAAAKERLSKRELADFYKSVGEKEAEYINSLREDVSRFCKKFDYRYAEEPWEGAKDAPERAIRFLSGK